MTRSLVTTLINSLLHFLLVSLFGKGILKILSSLFLLDVEQPKIEQFAPGIWKNCEHTPSTTKQHNAQNVCTLGGRGARKIFIKELEQ